MPHFTLPIDPQGPILTAYVGVSHARAIALQTAQQVVPPPQPIRALLDTGATVTCMDPSVMSALGIPSRGTTLLGSSTSGNAPATVNVYDVSIAVPGATPPPHVLGTIAVAESPLLTAYGFHALIGRDILAGWTVYYNGPVNMFTVSY